MIVALVIVGVILVIYMYPQLGALVGGGDIVPGEYLQNCLQPEVKNAVDLLAKQGGSQNPEAFITYQDTKIAYLCYASGYYKTCVVQQPMLISHFGSEISAILMPKAEQCMRNLITEYERRGYSVSASQLTSEISLAPGRVAILYNSPMTVTLEGNAQTFDKFDVGVQSGIYDLLAISTSVVDYEATYGDTETRLYSQYYPNLKMEKIKLEDGIKIYKLTDVVNEDSFTFATRSLVWPPGYGL